MQKEKILENNNKVPSNFNCPFCDEKFESKVNLNQHVRRNHHRDQVCQTELHNTKHTKNEVKPETEYLCFYCEQRISSCKEKLQKHRFECCEVGRVLQEKTQNYLQPFHALKTFPALHTFYPPPFTLPTDAPCYTCSERFLNKIELRRHYTESHPDFILFWCDVCLTNFGSERGLKSHMRNNHKDYS